MDGYIILCNHRFITLCIIPPIEAKVQSTPCGTIPPMNIAIQGQAGSFHAEAAKKWFGNNARLIECASFSEVFHMADTKDADAIVTAVENTIYGSINEVYQLIDELNWPIVGEIMLPIAHQLIGLPETDLSSVKKIYSHPVALAQCRHNIEKLLPQAEMVEYFDTAGAVEFVKAENNPSYAAIASEGAASLYELPIISANLQDTAHNITKFVVLSPSDEHRTADANRASMVLITNHQPGALFDALSVFAEADINLAKLQSQPIVGSVWRYKFFIVADCTPSQIGEIKTRIEDRGHTLKILGVYESASD